VQHAKERRSIDEVYAPDGKNGLAGRIVAAWIPVASGRLIDPE